MSRNLNFYEEETCLTNLLAYLESVTKHVDNGLPMDTLFLLMKLKDHGIDGVVLEWIRRWLTDRNKGLS